MYKYITDYRIIWNDVMYLITSSNGISLNSEFKPDAFSYIDQQHDRDINGIRLCNMCESEFSELTTLTERLLELV